MAATAIVVGLLPLVPHIVVGIEKLFGHKNGAQKKAAATAAIADAANGFASLNNVGGANTAMMDYIGALIDDTVAYFNATGVFTHATKSS